MLVLDGDAVAVGRAQVRELLTLLAARNHRSVSVDELIDHFWSSELPAAPRKALNVLLSRLRTALGPAANRLWADGDSYILDLDDTDVEAFQQLIEAGRTATGPDSIIALRSALELWTTAPMADADGAASLTHLQLSLDEERWFAVTRLCELLGDAGDPSAAVEMAQPFFAERPHLERLASGLAVALARAGRKSEALDVVTTCTARLRGELGLDPSRSLLDTERSILDGSVELASNRPVHRRPDADLFVGRAAEVKAVRAVGRQRPLLIVAEPGMGKSALLQHVRRLESADGGSMIWVTAPASPEVAMEPIVDLIRQLDSMYPDRADSGDRRSLMERLGVRATGRPESVLSRDALLTIAADYIAAAARDTLIAIDDAQWLDVGSIDVLSTVLQGRRCRLVLATRPLGDTADPFLRDREADRIDLAPLHRADIRDLAELAVGKAAEAGAEARLDALVDSVEARAGGNSLFVRLLLDRWVEGVGSARSVPTTVLVAVQQRLEELPRRTTDALRLAATVGPGAGLHLLRSLRPSIDGDLDEAVAAGLITVDRATDRVHFLHELVAEACYELHPQGLRVVAHDEIGRLLQADGAPAGEYAQHFLRSADLDPHRALTAQLDAAAEFVDGFAWDLALDRLVDAESVADRHGSDDVHNAELLVRKGAALRALGRAGSDEALLAGAALAEQLGDDELYAVAAIELCGHGQTTTVGSTDARALPVLERALRLTLDPAQRAELCGSASVLLAQSNDGERARQLFHEALDLVTELGDVEVEASVLANAHLGLCHPDDFDRLQVAAIRLGELAGADAGMQWESAFLRFGTSAVLADAVETDRAVVDMRSLTSRVFRRGRDFGMAFTESSHAVRGVNSIERSRSPSRRSRSELGDIPSRG